MAATELLTLSGDVRTLTNKNLSGLHIKCLKDRIAGGLAGLEIMLRLSDQETGRVPTDFKPAWAFGLDRLLILHRI